MNERIAGPYFKAHLSLNCKITAKFVIIFLKCSLDLNVYEAALAPKILFDRSCQ